MTAAVGLLAVLARAEVVLSRVDWQIAVPSRKQRDVFHDVQTWLFPPGPNVSGRPRARVTLLNRGQRPEGAVLLHYAFSARLVKIQGGGPGTWAIPFLIEDRHIPQTIAPNATKEVPVYVNRVALDAYMKRLYRAGFWMDELRIQTELEPRPGETLKDRIMEKALPIIWKQAHVGDKPTD